MSPQELQERRKARIEEYLNHNFSKSELVDMLAEAMSLPRIEGNHKLAQWLESERKNFFESDFSTPFV